MPQLLFIVTSIRKSIGRFATQVLVRSIQKYRGCAVAFPVIFALLGIVIPAVFFTTMQLAAWIGLLLVGLGFAIFCGILAVFTLITPTWPPPKRAVNKNWWKHSLFLLIGLTALIVFGIVGTFVLVDNSQSQQVGESPTDLKVLQEVTSVQWNVFASVKTGGLPNVLQPPTGNPPLLTGADGKPKIFFYGAEFCPFCAGERWSVVVALSRFGTFKRLPLIVSADADLEPRLPDISTFTFVGSQYSSSYIDFESLEALDRVQQTLQNPSPAQQKLLTEYDVQGVPFIDIADRYTASGALFYPTLLKGLSHQEIASQLSDPTQDVTQKIVGAANYFTAAICAATDNKPDSVCTSDPIPGIRSLLAANTPVSLAPDALGMS